MKKVIVTPAGRKRYLQILVKYIHKEVGTFDEWHLWLNTNVASDIEYCNFLENTYSWIKVKRLPNINTVSNGNIFQFFQFAKDHDTIYIRLDDDIVFLESGFFTKLFNSRIENPEPFLIYPNIINNAIISHIHQRNKLFKLSQIIQYDCLDAQGWGNPKVAEIIHRAFIHDVKSGNISKWKQSFQRWELLFYEQVSVNCISWFGSSIANVDVQCNEEEWLSKEYPKSIQKPNLIINEPICVHFSFFTQRDHLDKTNILNEYDSLV